MGASVWPRCPCFFVRVTSDGGTAESCSASDASTLRTRKKRRKKDGGCKRKGCFRRDGKRGIGGKEGGGLEMGKEGGRRDCNTQAAGSAAGQ